MFHLASPPSPQLPLVAACLHSSASGKAAQETVVSACPSLSELLADGGVESS